MLQVQQSWLFMIESDLRLAFVSQIETFYEQIQSPESTFGESVSWNISFNFFYGRNNKLFLILCAE